MRTEDTKYGADYWQTMDGGLGYQKSTMWQDIAHIVKEMYGIRDTDDISGSVSTLDVGCAYGYLVEQLRDRGFDAWGCDISEFALEHAPEHIKPWLRHVDITQPGYLMPQAYESFKLVVCMETCEHLPEDRVHTALSNIYRTLVPGGQALFTICTDDQPGWDTDPTHVTMKSRDWWIERMAQVGFVTDDVALQERLMTFWLFKYHHGVITVRR